MDLKNIKYIQHTSKDYHFGSEEIQPDVISSHNSIANEISDLN